MDYRGHVYMINTSNYNEGCGFLIGDLFITCGHVVERSQNPWISHNGIRVPLDTPLLYMNNRNPEGYDIAVFRIEDGNSPLSLSSDVPQEGDVIESNSFRTIKQGVEFVKCKATVGKRREGNYFDAVTDFSLKEGSSGSPVFYKDKVIGMIAAGNNKEGEKIYPDLPLNFCMFLSSASIMRLLMTQGLLGTE